MVVKVCLEVRMMQWASIDIKQDGHLWCNFRKQRQANLRNIAVFVRLRQIREEDGLFGTLILKVYEKLTAEAYSWPIAAKVQHMQKVQHLQSLTNPILIAILIQLVQIFPKVKFIRFFVEFRVYQHVMVLFASPIME